MKRATLIMLAAGLLIAASAAFAEEAAGGRVPVPHPPKGKGTHCVAPIPFMRRYHMMMLYHHRKQYVHEGITTKQYDIARCVSCHAVKGPDGKYVTYASPKHFCRSCHDYEAVKIDCFECHNSVPPAANKSADAGTMTKESEADAARLADYLKNAKPAVERESGQ